MRDYVLLLICTVVLAWCADHITISSLNPNGRRRLIFCSLVIFVLMAGFAGLRTYCNDTGTYRAIYEHTTLDSWSEADKSIGSNPLFNWINYQLKMRGVSTQNFLMFWAVITVACYIVFVYRYSVDYPLTVFLLFATGCYSFAFAGIKQAAAVGIALIAVMFALRRRWILYGIGILIATLIHPYALMYLLVPIMQFRPWSRKTYILLALAVGCGFMLRPLLGTVVSITTLLGEEYTAESFTGDGVNMFRVLVCNAPLVVSFLYRKQMFENTTREENLMVNLTMLNGAIMFVGLFGTANYFGRLANYFLIFQSLSLPWMLKRIGGREGRMWTIFVVLGYVGYFYYANMINQPFDQNFARLTLKEYFAQLGGN